MGKYTGVSSFYMPIKSWYITHILFWLLHGIIIHYPFTLKRLQDILIFACVYYYEPVDSCNEKHIFVEKQG